MGFKKSLEFKIVAVVVTVLLLGAVIAGVIMIYVQKATLFNIFAESAGKNTASIVLKDIEATMVEGKADTTKDLIRNLKGILDVEEISVLDPEGGDAFDKASLAKETDILKELKAGKESVLQRDRTRVIFYLPLKNQPSCLKCHGGEKTLLGAVKISFSIEKEYRRAMSLVTTWVIVSTIALLCFSFLIWAMLRKLVISPIKSIHAASAGISDGDFSFDADIPSDDEIGSLSRRFKESFRSLGEIIVRIKEQSGRVSKVAEDVEKESKNIVRGAEVEGEAFNNISSSVEEMSATAVKIADSTEALAASVGEASASIEEMVSSITNVNENIHELSSAVESTSSSIEELSATIKEVASGAEELAGASQETLSAVSEITTVIREVEVSAKESAKLSEKVTSDASTFGKASIEKTIEGMKNIKSSVERTADFIGRLGGRSDEIGKILTVIDEVTDQTTLLALNAAILAAQAGEHGKGFSVVADEIKDLAERTAFSTQEIASLIQSVQQEVKSAVEAMEGGLVSVEEGLRLSKEAGDALKKILESSKRSSEMALSIDRSMAEQAKAARLASEAMERVWNMTDQIAKSTSEETKGVNFIIAAMEKMRDASRQVTKATEEQTVSIRQISQAMELVSDRSQQISNALSDHKLGSKYILNILDGVRNIPVENRKLSYRVGSALRDLYKDSELLRVEMERFKFDGSQGDVVRFGVLPLESPVVMFKKFTPLVAYLNGKLGKRVEVKVAADFESAITDIGQNDTQLCAMGPATYIAAHKIFGIKVLVKGLRDGKPYHRAAIITKSDSDVKSIEDLRGRTFAFGDVHSSSGYILPRLILRDAGIHLGDLRFYHHLKHHDEVAEAVLSGDFEAGAVGEWIAQKYTNQGIRVIRFSDDIPEMNICSNNSLDARDTAIIRTALISLSDSSPEGAAILKSIDEHFTGFVESIDGDFDNVRAKMSKLGLI